MRGRDKARPVSLAPRSELVGHQRRVAATDLVPDPHVMIRLAQETEADHDPGRGNDHWVDQAAQGDPGVERPRTRPVLWRSLARPRSSYVEFPASGRGRGQSTPREPR